MAKNIYAKMLDITSELSAVAKNLEVGFGKNRYKAVGEADVLAAVKPLEVKHGIYSYPSKRSIAESLLMTKTDDYGKEKQSQFVRVETEYTFVNVENPEEKITVTSYGDGVDSQDKAPGKAMTYADKYALLKAYKIITGDDPDQNASEEGRFEKKQQKTPTREKEATKEQRDGLTQACQIAGVTTKWISEQVGITQGHLTVKQYNEAMQILNRIIDEEEKKHE